MEIKADLSNLRFSDKTTHASVFSYFRRTYVLISDDLHTMAEMRLYEMPSHSYVKLFLHRHGYDGFGSGFSRSLGMSRELEAFKKAVADAGIEIIGESGDIHQIMTAIGHAMTEQPFRCFCFHP